MNDVVLRRDNYHIQFGACGQSLKIYGSDQPQSLKREASGNDRETAQTHTSSIKPTPKFDSCSNSSILDSFFFRSGSAAMIETEVIDNELIDWENLLDNVPDEAGFDLFDDPGAATASAAGGMDSCFSIDDIEQYLMNDESNSDKPVAEHHDALTDDFFSDLLLDSPHGSWFGSEDLSKDSSSSPDSVVVEAEEEEREDCPHEKNNSSASPGSVVVEAREEEREKDSSHEKNCTPMNEDKGGDGETDDPADKKRKRYYFSLSG